MARNIDLKEVYIKNRTCHYLDDIINIHDNDLHSILLDEKSYEDDSIYHAAYKTPNGVEPLHIIFAKVYRYIIKEGKTKYLTSLLSNQNRQHIW